MIAGSLEITDLFRVYFSTIDPPAFGVFRLLFPLDDDLAVGTVFGSIAFGSEELAAADAVLQIVDVEQSRVQRLRFGLL